MKKILLILVLISLSINIIAQSKERFAKPVDEAANDVSLKVFRDSLIQTVKRKNKKQLISALDKNIKVSFGTDSGIQDFIKFWNLDSPETKVWHELLLVLENGGSFTGEDKDKTFCAPYLFLNFPEDLDAFTYNAIFGDNVNLREKPNLSSKVVMQLSYNVVKIDFENSVTSTTDPNKYIWTKINTLGDKTGYVSADFVRSPIDYRACFQKINGSWKMTAFVAGD
jgi:hypothetical protein